MNNITFVIQDEFLLTNEDLHPQPISNFIPKWYADMDISKPKSNSLKDFIDTVFNVKSCPSFVEVYKDGFVIPAPHDFYIQYDKATKNWAWQTPIKYKDFSVIEDGEQVTVHGNEQMLDYLPNNPYNKIFKFNLPYKVITDKGISIRQLPIPYAYNKKWEAMYGIFRSDKVHEVNIQIGYKTDDKELLIKQGEPLCVYAPFKREKFNLKIKNTNNIEANLIKKNLSKLYSSFNKNFKNLDYYLDA